MGKATGVYGPAVIGEKKYKAEQEIVKTKANIYGPAVLGDHPASKALEEAKTEMASAEKKLEEVQASAKAKLEQAGDDDEARETAKREITEERRNAQERLLAARKKAGTARSELARTGPVGSELTEPKRPLVDEQPPDPPPPGDPEVEATDDVADAVANVDWGSLSVKQLENALDTYANAMVPALDAELQRDEPRVTALRAILAAEQARHGGAREEVVKRIEEAL